MKENWGIETQAVQGTYWPENAEPRVLPLIQSTTYRYDTCEELAKVFDLEQESHMYTRLSNPTTDAFEKKIALMEGGVGALATSSGMSATVLAFLNIAQAGDGILASSTIYGGSFTLFATTFKNLGIEVILFNPELSAEEIIALGKPNTKAIFGETIGNPLVNVIDFEKFSKVSKALDIPFIVDNTFATAALCKPLKLGAHIVIYSTSKYIDGHASVLGGIVVDGGNFNWDNGKFPGLVEPDESYHGVSYINRFGTSAYIVKARVQLMRNMGMTPAPFNSYLMNLGSETLHLRMERHSENALKMATYLKNHEMCQWVKYPGLEGDEYYALAQKYLHKGASGVLTFGVKGGRDAARKFINALKLVALVTHVADVRSCVLQPASTTHRQLSDEELIACGVSPDMIRFSVGIESADDLIADFEQAFAQCK
ncbi:MAG: O-acetylhomoserine aminocarboxypropyltransferase/cysteine synthase family protein [Lachnospiraceae bacterium]|nr:O-acetylhomoserine aminocarboxypropyltransferase/cysteine synthase family protein [Lachnospiraceae bacterium]